MIHQQIKELFFSSAEHIVSDISQYAVHPVSYTHLTLPTTSRV